MRIGFVCPYSFAAHGGVQNHILGLAGWLKSAGHQVSIFAPDNCEEQVLADYGLVDGEYQSSGWSVPLKCNGSVARINYGIKPALASSRWQKQGQFDVLHIHEPFTPSVAWQSLMRSCSAVTVTFHTARPVLKIMRTLNELFPWGVNRIDESIAVSSVAYKVAHAHTGLVPTIIGNGMQVSDYQLQKTVGRWRGGDAPLLSFLGRYDEPRKGFQVLCAALPLIKAKFPDLRVVVIGCGSPMDIPGVEFLGGVSDAERNAWLAKSDVYVAPQTGRESFGIVLIEALASGAPVVASDLPAFIDVLSDENGVVGHSFASGNADQLARAVIASLSEPRDLRLASGRAVAERYDWSVIGPQVLAIYARAQQKYQLRARHRPS